MDDQHITEPLLASQAPSEAGYGSYNHEAGASHRSDRGFEGLGWLADRPGAGLHDSPSTRSLNASGAGGAGQDPPAKRGNRSSKRALAANRARWAVGRDAQLLWRRPAARRPPPAPTTGPVARCTLGALQR